MIFFHRMIDTNKRDERESYTNIDFSYSKIKGIQTLNLDILDLATH